MANFHHLDIYKASLKLLVELAKVAKHFEKNVRFTVAERLHTQMISFIIHIYKTNNEKNLEKRIVLMDEMHEKIQYIGVLLRLAFELRGLSKERHAQYITDCDDLEKQLSGWQNYTYSKISKLKEDKKEEEVINNKEIYTLKEYLKVPRVIDEKEAFKITGVYHGHKELEEKLKNETENNQIQENIQFDIKQESEVQNVTLENQTDDLQIQQENQVVEKIVRQVESASVGEQLEMMLF